MRATNSCKGMEHSLFINIHYILNMRNTEIALVLVLKEMEVKSLMAIILKR